MANRRPRLILWLLLGLIVLALVGQTVPLYTDWLWFQEVGYARVFVTILTLRGWLFIGVGLGTFLFLYGNLAFAARTARPDVYWELEDQLGLPGRVVLEPLIRRLLRPVLAVIAFFSGVSASANWETVLEYFNATPFGVAAPDVGWGLARDLSFYVFVLPFWRLLYGWSILLATATIGLSLALYVLQRSLVLTARGPRLAAGARVHLLLLGTAFLVIKAWGFWLDRFEIMYSPRGLVFGASYTDVNASLPALGGLVVLTLLCAAACLLQVWRPGWRFLVAGLVVLGAVWVGGLGVYPAFLQRFRVTPNELAAERPYIVHNVRMTRQGYGLDRVEEKDFPAEETLTPAALDRNNLTIKNIRLWDHGPLLTTFAQLQEIRPYYKFVDVDNDRYLIGGEYRQIMLSPRELSSRHLPGGEGWINEHLTYTHGYGVIVGPVNRISPEGLPEFFVKDIPPVSTNFPKITRPQIYYGERANDFVFIGTKSQELDYASGDQNVYTRYAGRGGIPVASFLTKLAFAVRFGKPNIILSDDLTRESRIMIHREVGRRVRQVAPFLRFDRDPYVVVTDDGRLVWMIDGYTVTDRYPYSQPVPNLGNYIRNSVKATVDAYHGTVAFYLADAADPLIRTYARAFPGLFKPLGDMPADLQRHIRYPEDLFTVQARMYATYHMEDPQVFYNKEDLWTIPRRAVEGREREMEPYYTIMRLPGETKEEFILLTLFNPIRRDNMIAWMAARSDRPNYGRLIVYNFPKASLVYGPRQIDARINQDPIISQQLSLWNQRGSTTIPGSLLAIPIDQSLIYVQPLYLAAEKGALPELRRVFVAYGNQIAMEPTLEQSLQRIFGGRGRIGEAGGRPAAEVAPSASRDAGLQGLIRKAWEAWSRAQDALRRGDWSSYGEEQRRLEQTLQELRDRAGR